MKPKLMKPKTSNSINGYFKNKANQLYKPGQIKSSNLLSGRDIFLKDTNKTALGLFDNPTVERNKSNKHIGKQI